MRQWTIISKPRNKGHEKINLTHFSEPSVYVNKKYSGLLCEFEPVHTKSSLKFAKKIGLNYHRKCFMFRTLKQLFIQIWFKMGCKVLSGLSQHSNSQFTISALACQLDKTVYYLLFLGCDIIYIELVSFGLTAIVKRVEKINLYELNIYFNYCQPAATQAAFCVLRSFN